MKIGRFFSSDSQMSKQSSSNTAANASASTGGSVLPSKNNVVSIVEYKFRRMTEEHDRIRAALLSQSQTSR